MIKIQLLVIHIKIYTKSKPSATFQKLTDTAVSQFSTN